MTRTRVLSCLGMILAVACGCSTTKPSTAKSAEAPAATPPRASSGQQSPQSVPPKSGVTKTQAPGITYGLCSQGLPDKGMWKCDPVFADFNGDGMTDLAALPRLGVGPRAWIGNGKGEWTESSNGLQRVADQSCGGGLSVTDVDRDGKQDLVVADHCRGIYVYQGDGKGNWTTLVEQMYPVDVVKREGDTDMYRGAEDLATGDVDGDGMVDIISGSSDNGGINHYRGDGTGKNWTRVPGNLPGQGWANRVQLADVNGDKHLDVAAGYSDGPRVWLNDGKGNWTASSEGLPSPMIRGLYTGVAVGDVNGDGRADLAAANWVDGPEVYVQEPNGSWRKLPDVFPQMYGGSIGLAMGDLDSDGHQDLVVAGRLEDGAAGYVRGVFALKGDGTGNFRFLEQSGLPNTGLAATVGIALADINKDGTLDIAAGSGLIVESSAKGPKEPTIAPKLIVWCGQQPVRGASLTSAPDKP